MLKKREYTGQMMSKENGTTSQLFSYKITEFVNKRLSLR